MMELMSGLLVAFVAVVCIAAGRLLGRIRDDAVGKVFLVLGGFFLALAARLLHWQALWVVPVAVVAGLLVGNYYIQKRGLH